MHQPQYLVGEVKEGKRMTACTHDPDTFCVCKLNETASVIPKKITEEQINDLFEKLGLDTEEKRKAVLAAFKQSDDNPIFGPFISRW